MIKEYSVYLTKAEIDALKDFADVNLAAGVVEIHQVSKSQAEFITKVQVLDLPETLTDITDRYS